MEKWKSGAGFVSNSSDLYRVGATPINKMAALGMSRSEPEETWEQAKERRKVFFGSKKGIQKALRKRFDSGEVGVLSVGYAAYKILEEDAKARSPFSK